MAFKPLDFSIVLLTQRSLLQRFERRMAPLQGLQLTAGLIQVLRELGVFRAL